MVDKNKRQQLRDLDYMGSKLILEREEGRLVWKWNQGVRRLRL